MCRSYEQSTNALRLQMNNLRNVVDRAALARHTSAIESEVGKVSHADEIVKGSEAQSVWGRHMAADGKKREVFQKEKDLRLRLSASFRKLRPDHQLSGKAMFALIETINGQRLKSFPYHKFTKWFRGKTHLSSEAKRGDDEGQKRTQWLEGYLLKVSETESAKAVVDITDVNDETQ